MSLLKIWSHFAGPIPTKLALSKAYKESDDTLLKKLDLAREEYGSLPALKHYFSSPPSDPKRKLQWAESRRCILEVLKGLPATNKTFVSLSHTSSESIAISCFDEKGLINGVGVDMEKANRIIETEATEKFIFESELKFGMPALAIWTVKEASYKADTLRRGTVVSHYEIQSFDKVTGEGRVALKTSNRPFIKFQFQNFENLAVTFAISEN